MLLIEQTVCLHFSLGIVGLLECSLKPLQMVVRSTIDLSNWVLYLNAAGTQWQYQM